jgi:hypothetical protein
MQTGIINSEKHVGAENKPSNDVELATDCHIRLVDGPGGRGDVGMHVPPMT